MSDIGHRIFGPSPVTWELTTIGSLGDPDKRVRFDGRRGMRTRSVEIALGPGILSPAELLGRITKAVGPLHKQLCRDRRETMFPFRPGRRRTTLRVPRG